MSYRLLAVVIVGLLFALAQVRPDVDEFGQPSETVSAGLVRWVPTITVVLADNNEDNSDDNSGSQDNSGSGDNGGDNSDSEDNSDSGGSGNNNNSNSNSNSNSNGNDNGASTSGGNSGSGGNGGNDGNDGTVIVMPPIPPGGGQPLPSGPPVPTPFPTPVIVADDEVTDDDAGVTSGTVTSDGGIAEVRIRGGRLIVRILPTLDAGYTVTLRLIDPGSVARVPGALAGNLVFMVEARGPNGAPLATLPAEVNMNVRYDDADVAGLNEAALIVSHLDQPGNAWRPAPKLIRDPDTNFLAASVTAMGAYAVHAP